MQDLLQKAFSGRETAVPIVGLGVSAYEAALFSNGATCPVSGCAVVSSSSLAAIPWGLVAASFFILILVRQQRPQCLPRIGKTEMWSAIAFAISTALTLYSTLILRALCPPCLVTFLCVSLIFLGGGQGKRSQMGAKWTSFVAVIIVGIGVGSAIATPNQHRSNEKVSESEWNAVRQFPKIGGDNPQVGLVTDLACPHCREAIKMSLATGRAFYLIPLASETKADSLLLLESFVASRRSGLEKAFLERIPDEPLIRSWLKKINHETKLMRSDTREARDVSGRAKALAEKLRIRTVPYQLTPAKA